MLDKIEVGKAAALLYAALLQKKALKELPADCRPQSLSEAYAIQDRLVTFIGKTAGYKIGFTNPTIQKRLKINEPASGHLLADRMFPSPATFDASRLFRIGIETEFAFRIGDDLPATDAPFERAQVLAAVESLVPAIEIVDSRFADWSTCGVSQAVADNVFGSHWVYGQAHRDWRGIDLPALCVITTINGREAARGSGANVLGDPVNALLWLANDLPSRKLSLRAGDYVTTGSCTDIVIARSGDSVRADFDQIGSINIDIK